MKRILFCLISIILHSHADKSSEDEGLLRVGPPLFGTRSTTERPLWELVPPFPAEAGHRLFAPRPEYLKSQIHFPKRDPGELVYGNEENIGQGYEGPEPGTVMRISGSRSKRYLKSFLNAGIDNHLSPVYDNEDESIPHTERNIDLQNYNIQRDKLKDIMYKFGQNSDNLIEQLFNEEHLEDMNKILFRPSRKQFRISQENIPKNVKNIYNSPIRMGYNFNAFDSPDEVYRRRSSENKRKSHDHKKDINKPLSIVINLSNIGSSYGDTDMKKKDTYSGSEINNPDIDATPNDYYAIKRFDTYSKHFDEHKKGKNGSNYGTVTKKKYKHKNKNKLRTILLNEKLSALTENNTLMEKEILPDDFNTRIGNENGDYRNNSKTSGMYEHPLNDEDNSESDKKRRKRSVIWRKYYRRMQEDTHLPILERRTKEEDPKDKILKAFKQLEKDFVKKTRRNGKVINEPDLESPEDLTPKVQPKIRKLFAGCCTTPPLYNDSDEKSSAVMNMTGDHMNIYPEAPEWEYPEVHLNLTGLNRPWWYYNQDDYQPFKPKIPDYVLRV